MHKTIYRDPIMPETTIQEMECQLTRQIQLLSIHREKYDIVSMHKLVRLMNRIKRIKRDLSNV